MAREPGYCCHKASGQAFVRLGGRIIYLGKHGSPESHELYNRLKSEWLLNRHAAVSRVTLEGPTIAEVCLAFLDHAQQYYPTGNEYNNFEQAIKPLSELYAMLPIRKFGPVEFRTVRNWWLNKTTSRQAGKCSRKTINDQMNRVKRLFKWAVSEGMVDVSVYETLRCVEALKRGRCTAPESKPVKPVDKATVDATLPHLTSIVADMVRVQFHQKRQTRMSCGNRPGSNKSSAPKRTPRTSFDANSYRCFLTCDFFDRKIMAFRPSRRLAFFR